MKRGDIYWADLIPRSGSEQRGRRPVMIISHDGFNQTPSWHSIIVVPLSTSATQAKRGPTVIPIQRGTSGLKKDSVVLCHQITTLDRSKLVERIGIISQDLLNEVETGLKIAMGIDL